MAEDLDADGDRGAEIVWAAGGTVWRRAPGPASSAGGPEVEVVLVHRPKYDDWSLPKGKLDAGESHEAAALREVLEETGLRCLMGDELRSAHYTDHRGRPKVVRYWAMTPEGQDVTGSGTEWFAPTKEIDELRWVPREEAAGLLDYEHDVAVVGSLSV